MMAICGAGVWLAMTMRQPSFCAFVGVGSPPVFLRVRVAGGLLFWWCYWALVVLIISMPGSLVAAFWMSRVRLSALRKCLCSGWVMACVMGVLWLVGVMVISVNGLVSMGWVMVMEWSDWGLV